MNPVSRVCPKCGHDGASVRHSTVLEALRMRCLVCEYNWQVKPLDMTPVDETIAATPEQIISARLEHSVVGELEFDDDARISVPGDPEEGYWIQGWIWIDL